jgi:transposase
MGAEGASIFEIAAGAGLTPKTTGKWRGRFRDLGPDGLADAPGRGRKKAHGAEERVGILALACTRPPDGSARRSVRKLAAAVGRSASFVQGVPAAGRPKPHRAKHRCGRSPDPESAAKRADIVGPCVSPPKSALVICVDEKSQIQALDRRQPCLPMRGGEPRRPAATYKRSGTTCLLAALTVHTGDAEARCVDGASGAEFPRFLKRPRRLHPGRGLRIIADNPSARKSREVRAWLASKRRDHMHYTPTYASWLNQVEIWFNMFTRDVVRGRQVRNRTPDAACGRARGRWWTSLWSTSGATTGTTPGHSAGPTPGSRSPYDDPFI